MPNLSAMFANLTKGLRDGMNFPFAIEIFAKSKTLKPLFVQCFILNGFLFVGSIIFFDYIAAPLFDSASSSSGALNNINNDNSMDVSGGSYDYISIILGVLFASLKNVCYCNIR